MTKWLSGAEMSSDLLTKNLPRSLHEKHTKTYCGIDKGKERRTFPYHFFALRSM